MESMAVMEMISSTTPAKEFPFGECKCVSLRSLQTWYGGHRFYCAKTAVMRYHLEGAAA